MNYRVVIIFEVPNGAGGMKTDAIWDVPHRVTMERVEKVIAAALYINPKRVARPSGEYVDVRA